MTRCARAACSEFAVDCTAVAIATGHYDAAALREAGADHVLATLEEDLPV